MSGKMKLAPSPTCNCGLEDQMAEHILQKARQNVWLITTHETLRQQGGTGEDSHIHLAGWTSSVAAIEKKSNV